MVVSQLVKIVKTGKKAKSERENEVMVVVVLRVHEIKHRWWKRWSGKKEDVVLVEEKEEKSVQ